MKGILFKTWEAKQKVLKEYGEAVTRRVINPQPEIICDKGKYSYYWGISPSAKLIVVNYPNLDDLKRAMIKKARYHKDEVLYVKEAYLVLDVNLKDIGADAPYRRTFVRYNDGIEQWKYMPKESRTQFTIPDKKHSPMFMPQWAARYFIQITDVRPEILKLPLPADEFKLEGGDAVLYMLQEINNLWVFRYAFKEGKDA